MKHLPLVSLWQPWANAIVTPHPTLHSGAGILPVKRNETRSWPTKFTGRVLVHAAQKKSGKLDKIYKDWPFNLFHKELMHREYGCIIGSVEITGCITSECWIYTNSPEVEASQEEYHMGDFTAGRYAFSLLNPIRFKQSIPYKGQQGKILNVPASLIPKEYQQHFDI